MIPRFVRFVLVGSTGFVTDVAVLWALISLGSDPFLGRVASIGAATLVTWRLNRSYTFGPGPRSQWVEGSRYASVVAVASTVNWLVYAALLVAVPGLLPYFAVAVGAIAALTVSYLGFSRFAFR